MKKIDKNSRIPLYSQLMDLLIAHINSLDCDDKLMSEREICEIYDLSRTTVRQALDSLEQEGYIYKLHGKGSFVAEKIAKKDLMAFYSFTDEMRKIGKIPSSSVLNFEIVESTEKLNRIFNFKEDQLFFKVIRVREADKVPMMYETTYLPYRNFENLSESMIKSKPLYDIFNENFNIILGNAEEVFEPILTNKLESFYLSIEEGTPSLKVERFTYDEGGRLIEYTISIARGDKFKYKIKLNRN
ncbi:MAG: GntR family transcriptional regulator [Sarcina sp.]